MLKVSCILTSYNRPVFIQDSIASVLKQTYPHWELLIVDDNSNQQTQNLLSSYPLMDSRIRIIQSNVQEEDRPKTTRYATCINLAIPHLTGDLITYLTDDDIYLPERFEKMVELFEANPHIYVIYGNQRIMKVNNGIFEEVGIRGSVGITRQVWGVLDHNSIMHRTSCFSLVPRWDDNPSIWAWADAVFFRSLAAHWDFHPLNIVTDEHRQHNHSVQAKAVRGEIFYSEKTE